MSGCTYRITACKDAGVRINQVACGSGYIIMGEPGMMVPITAMYDKDGEPTDDVDEVCWVDFGDDEFGEGHVEVMANPDPHEYLN